MAVLNISFKGLDAALNGIDTQVKEYQKGFEGALTDWAIDTAGVAKQKAPVDLGQLRNSINPNLDKIKLLQASVTVNVFYAAYVEFGTRTFAAAEVAKLPADWQKFAALFKGRPGGGKGMPAQPYLYPAYVEMTNQLIKDLKAVLNK